MRFLLDLAWRDLRASGRSLWVFCACLALGVTLIAATGEVQAHASTQDVNQSRPKQPVSRPKSPLQHQIKTLPGE